MHSFRNKYVSGPLALVVALVVTASIALASGGVAASSAPSAPAASSARTVAHTAQGKLGLPDRRRDQVPGRPVTGSFVPLKFIKRDGKIVVRGLLKGVVHKADGSTRTFGVMRTLRVKSINGTPATTNGRVLAAAPACDVLQPGPGSAGPRPARPAGAPLDKVVLNIVAQSGAGQLLGNLLCAVVGPARRWRSAACSAGSPTCSTGSSPSSASGSIPAPTTTEYDATPGPLGGRAVA